MSLGLELEHERAFLRRLDSVAIRELPGFVRGRQRLPTEHGRAGDLFVQTLVEQAVGDEVRAVYDAAKRLLGLRRRQLERAIAIDGGNVEAPQFHFVIEIGLDPANIARALWQRQVIPLAAPHSLPFDFDEVFPVACDELVVPIANPRTDGMPQDFDLVVERLEDFAQLHGGAVEEDEDQAQASLTTSDGSRIALDLGAHELSLRMLGVSGCRALLLEAGHRFAELTGPIVSRLEARA
ncbi:hypothetical protein DB30_06922 [Enhygromyxa salina]|uniref:Uncharacterized protein n=1 Tax=Enhygromyxa salina TaxID=215803 RepID=A0A0C2CXG6_9BACT|nr:hypothetical protein [Enhygromyxa salina]KIG14320.1 hypothetical protein DB30_06922 [Enhygromyxa salina]